MVRPRLHRYRHRRSRAQSVDGITTADEEIAQLLRAGHVAGSTGRRKVPVIVIAGKADNQERRDAANEFYALGFEDVVPVSALHGANSGDMLDLILSKLNEA